MIEQEQRAAVIKEAREWATTPYHHNACLKGIGTDCAGFPLKVYQTAGLLPAEFQQPHYSSQWHLHRSEEQYVEWALKFAREITPEELQPADFILWRWGRTFSHGGIYLGDDLVIHAYVDEGVQIDNIKIHCELSYRPARYFSLWGR